MPTYLYFGEDEFFLSRTIKKLKTHTLDQQWSNFNYTEYPSSIIRYHDTTVTHQPYHQVVTLRCRFSVAMPTGL